MFQGLLFFCASQIPQSRQLKIGGKKVISDKIKVDIVESNFVYEMNETYTLESVKKLDESNNQTL